MTFLPIIERELRVRARRGGTYWMRFVVAAFSVLVCLMQLTMSSVAGGVAAAGSAAFHALVAGAFLLCCGACLITADAISSERREGSLGLLFLTRVRGHDVLLGKLAAAALAGLCAVLTFLPVLMIPVLSGGVTGGETFRKGLVLLDTLFLGLAVGLWASARGEDWLVTVRKAALLMLVILTVPPLYGFLTRDLPSWSHTAAAFSPITGLLAASDLDYRADPGQYWIALVLLHLLGWLLLWRAGVVLRRNLHEAAPAITTDEPSPALTVEPITPRRRSKPLTEQTEPVAWLAGRQRGLSPAVWAGVLLAGSYLVFNPFLFRFLSPGSAVQLVLWPTSLLLNVGKVALFAWAASRFFVESRRTGELELLVTTPRGVATLVSAHWEVLKRVFRWPVVVLLAPMLLRGALMLWSHAAPSMGAWKVPYAVSLGISSINICLQVAAICWMGMWFGLKGRNQAAVIAWTVGVVGLMPQLLAWVFSLGVGVFARFIPGTGPVPPIQFLASWLPDLLTLVFYLWLIFRAKRLLSGDIRQVELQPLVLENGFRGLWRDGLAAIRKSRHWTPS